MKLNSHLGMRRNCAILRTCVVCHCPVFYSAGGVQFHRDCEKQYDASKRREILIGVGIMFLVGVFLLAEVFGVFGGGM